MQHQLVENHRWKAAICLDAPDNARGSCSSYTAAATITDATTSSQPLWSQPASAYSASTSAIRAQPWAAGPARDGRCSIPQGMAIVQCGDAPLFVIGHSMGGLETAVFASKFPTVISGYVFASPF